MNYLYYGDSIMFGNELGAQQYTHRWPTQYTALKGGVASNDDNHAQSGAVLQNAWGGNGPFELISDADIPDYWANMGMFFLGYGVNDYFRGISTGIANLINVYTASLEVQLQRLKNNNNYPAGKIAVVINYLAANAPYSVVRSEYIQFRNAIRAVCEAEGVNIVDFDTFWDNHPDKANYSDGDLIHPNASSNTIMANNVDSIMESPAVNTSPTVNAGADQSITLPLATVTLQGSASDSDGTISSHVWTKQSGPAGGTIVSASSYSTAVNDLQEGTYVFRLTATDDDNSSSYDEVTVTVNAAFSEMLYGNWVE